jgi:hypothetical protein
VTGAQEEIHHMTIHASGAFDVKLTPQSNEKVEGGALGRMSIEKQYHGDLEASATGEMLTAMSNVKGSAGYVAIEQVSGALGGRTGSFVLQHNATMTRGVSQQAIMVVPDCATGQFEGLAGTVTINIVEGKHFYKCEFTLPDAP